MNYATPPVSPDGESYWDGARWAPVPKGDARWNGTEWNLKPKTGVFEWDGRRWAEKPSEDARWNGSKWVPYPDDGKPYAWDGQRWERTISTRSKGIIIAVVVLSTIAVPVGALFVDPPSG